MRRIAKTVEKCVGFLTILVILSAAIITLPRLVGIEPYITLSGSMEPEIKTGSIVYVNTKDQDVEVGDIVTYRLTGDDTEVLVTHRIVREDNGLFITKGDANDSEDLAPIRQDQIVGTSMFSIPFAGYIAAKLKQKVVLVIIVWVVLLNTLSIILTRLSEQGNQNNGSTSQEDLMIKNEKERSAEDFAAKFRN